VIGRSSIQHLWRVPRSHRNFIKLKLPPDPRLGDLRTRGIVGKIRSAPPGRWIVLAGLPRVPLRSTTGLVSTCPSGTATCGGREKNAADARHLRRSRRSLFARTYLVASCARCNKDELLSVGWAGGLVVLVLDGEEGAARGEHAD